MRKNTIQDKGEGDVDLAMPHMPDYAFRKGMEVDALMFEAHKEEYKERLRKKIMT